MLKNNNIIEGKDGWLFLKGGGQQQFDYLTGIKKATITDKTNFSKNIKTRRKYCKTNNIIYKHVVFPSKPLVKTRYLPTCYKRSVTSLFLRDYFDLLDEKSKKSVFYPLSELSILDGSHSVFRKYDTHMTHAGTYEVAAYLLSLINISLVDYPVEYHKRDLGGDLCNMIQSSSTHNEDTIHISNANIHQVGNREFIPGNTNDVYLTHSFDSKTNHRLLIIGDSFFKELIRFLAPFFIDIMYIRSSTMQYDIAENFKPDVIFTGNAERYLSKVTSDDDSTPFLWDLYGDVSYSPCATYINAFTANLSYAHHNNYYIEWLKNLHFDF